MDTSSLPLFYRSVAALDRQAHARLKFRALDNFSFTADASLIPVLTAEFVAVAREYPIVFMRENADSEVFPVVLTGMPQGRNLFVNEAGRWDARYVPAYVRRYPFVFVETAPDDLAVCIDPTSKFLDEKQGVPLFGDDGEPSGALQDTIKALHEYQRVMHLTRAFMGRLAAANILMEANAKADLPDGSSVVWRGFWAVDEKRFRELHEATLKDWFATGELGLIYAHLLSLGNLAELLRRNIERTAPTVKPS
jgi:hypothetical protein